MGFRDRDTDDTPRPLNGDDYNTSPALHSDIHAPLSSLPCTLDSTPPLQVRAAFFSEDRFARQDLAPQAGEFGDV